MFHHYAKSVSKVEAIQSKNFFFTEEVTFENLDPKSKAEIIFGEKTVNYFDMAPPGKCQWIKLS